MSGENRTHIIGCDCDACLSSRAVREHTKAARMGLAECYSKLFVSLIQDANVVGIETALDIMTIEQIVALTNATETACQLLTRELKRRASESIDMEAA